MKKYFKDGKEVKRPKIVFDKQRTYLNPTDEKLIELGYEIKEKEYKIKLNNGDIKIKRENAYKYRADKYLIAYQAYKELGETEKALEMKKLWLTEREKIDKEFPYIVEEVKTE